MAAGDMMDRNFKGSAKRLDDIDLPTLGHLIGVGEDELHAFLDVETRGTGFDGQGRPIILFEPHIFYTQLGKGPKRDRAVREGLAYPKWGMKPYPKESYSRLVKAMDIDEEAALKSASWGLGQIMGFNHVSAGYETVQDMVTAFMADEENHLAAAVSFIKNNHLDDELRRHDWAGFARGYNGSGFAKNHYDVKLAEAFAKWLRIKDTPFSNTAKSEKLPVEPVQTIPVEVEPLPEETIEKPVAPVQRSLWAYLFEALLNWLRGK